MSDISAPLVPADGAGPDGRVTSCISAAFNSRSNCIHSLSMTSGETSRSASIVIRTLLVEASGINPPNLLILVQMSS